MAEVHEDRRRHPVAVREVPQAEAGADVGLPVVEPAVQLDLAKRLE